MGFGRTYVDVKLGVKFDNNVDFESFGRTYVDVKPMDLSKMDSTVSIQHATCVSHTHHTFPNATHIRHTLLNAKVTKNANRD